MNKLLLICLLGAALVALSGAEVSSEEQSVAEVSQLREVRAADPGKGNGNGKGKGKGKGKSLKKKNKKKKKGRKLEKSDKKGAGKKNGDKKKKSKKNGAKKSKKDGKGKKKRKNGAKKNGKGKKKKGLKKKSRKNESKGKGKNKDRKKKKARKAAKKEDKKDKKKKARKQKKKARKQKKKAKKQKKKARKDRKRNNNRKANTARNTTTTSSSCMNATCINNAVDYMKQRKGLVANFEKQYKRIERNEKQTGGKAGKGSEFTPYLTKLRETGGGNASNMTCAGEKNAGATNLENLYNSLAECETTIDATCNAGMPAVNYTFLNACKTIMDEFENKTDEAIELNKKNKGAEACLIWESPELANVSQSIKPCKEFKDTETAHTAAQKACIGNFSICRKLEDQVSELVSACSASNSAAKVTAAIAQGVANQAAATEVSTKVNSTLNTRSGSFRSTDVTCAVFATKVTDVSVQVTGAPLLASLGTMLKELANLTVATCSDDDKLSLGNASTTFLASTESIAIAIAEKQSALNIQTEGVTTMATTGTTGTGTTGTTTTGTTTTGTTSTTTTGTTTTGTTSTTTTGTTTTGTTSTTTTGTTTTGTTSTTTSTTSTTVTTTTSTTTSTTSTTTA